MIVVPTPTGISWGFDTSAKITPALLAALMRVDMHDYFPEAPKATPPGVLGRYGPLPENGPGNDLDAAELDMLASVATVVVFQHVRAGSWIASAQQGQADAEHILQYLQSIGWSGAAHVVKDCESCANSGLSAMQAFMQACAAWDALGAAYNGFAAGITPEQFAALGVPVARDAGDRTPPPGRGFCYEQRPQVMIAGTYFDPVCTTNDLLGQSLIGMAAPRAADGGPDLHVDPDALV